MTIDINDIAYLLHNIPEWHITTFMDLESFLVSLESDPVAANSHSNNLANLKGDEEDSTEPLVKLTGHYKQLVLRGYVVMKPGIPTTFCDTLTGRYIKGIRVLMRHDKYSDINGVHGYFKVTYYKDIDNSKSYLWLQKFYKILPSSIVFKPLYPKNDTEKTSKLVKNKVKGIISQISKYEVTNILHQDIRNGFGFNNLQDLLLKIHKPTKFIKSDRDLMEMTIKSNKFANFYKNIIYEALLYQQLSKYYFVAINANSTPKSHAVKCKIDQDIHQQFINNLEFALTSSQLKAIDEIYNDLSKTNSMNRILLGDVGSGKTIVCVAAMLQITKTNCGQCVLLVPNKILGFQHLKTLKKYLNPFHIEVDFLYSGLSSSNRREILTKLKTQPMVLIATHSAFNESIDYYNLILVIIDEQHKFGVASRRKLATRFLNMQGIHNLSLSATPIPRTLQLTMFGYMSLSELSIYKDYNTNTELLYKPHDPNTIKLVMNKIKELLANNQQIYWVCPAKRLTPSKPYRSCEEIQELFQKYEPNIKTCIVTSDHRKIYGEILEQFKKGTIQVLIGTSIIEVGLDVHQANMMIVDGGEYFGLANIHQLRGRVGRGKLPGKCLILSYEPKEHKRLRALLDSNNGYDISCYDLLLRGSGDLLGEAQSGQQYYSYISSTEIREFINKVVSIAHSINNHYYNQQMKSNLLAMKS